MEYINHINKYEDSQAIQDALDAGTLVNPYVAMTSAGTLDFNTLEPTPPAPSTMGYWTIGSGTEDDPHIFTLTELSDLSLWGDAEYTPTQIGTAINVYEAYSPDETILDLWLYYDENQGCLLLDTSLDAYPFEIGVASQQSTTIMTSPNTSTDYVVFDWDGDGTIKLYAYNSEYPLTIEGINPPYPSEEEPGE